MVENGTHELPGDWGEDGDGGLKKTGGWAGLFVTPRQTFLGGGKRKEKQPQQRGPSRRGWRGQIPGAHPKGTNTQIWTIKNLHGELNAERGGI